MWESSRKPLFTALFLLALPAWGSLWHLAGGQYHLDLISWAWKLGLTVAAASLTAAFTATSGRQAWAAAMLLLACLVAAGWLTYDAHLNEPTDEDDTETQLSRMG